MTILRDKPYISVITCETFSEANSILSMIGSKGFNTSIWINPTSAYEVCVWNSTRGSITLEDILEDIKEIGYPDAKIVTFDNLIK